MQRLLVVDDQRDICELLAAFLSEEGIAVTAAHHGAAALSALERERFDGVIVDAVLPGVSGVAVAEAASAAGIQVLLITGEPRSIERLDGNGRYPVLGRPFHLHEMRAALRSLSIGGPVAANADRPAC
jgi:two-component system response regulator CpxR